MDETMRVRQQEGTRFGELARALLGAGELIGSADFSEALAKTRSVLGKPLSEESRLFEAAFEFGGVRVRVDALEPRPKGDVLIEVKAATSVKRGDKSATLSVGEHIWDAAIQTWVVRGSGRSIHKVSVAHVDGDFTYTNPGDYRRLLKKVDVTRDVGILLPQVPQLVKELKRVADQRRVCRDDP